MFFPEPMTKVRVLCAKKSSEKAVQALYDFGLIHIVPSKAFQPGQPSSSFRNFSEKLVNLRSLCAALKIAPSGSGVLTEEDLASEWQVQDIEEALSWLRKSSELEANKDELLLYEIREGFLQRQNVLNKNAQATLELGTIQQQIKDTKEWIKYLEEKVKDA